MAIAIPIGLLTLYLQMRFMHLIYPKLVLGLVVAIAGGIMWFVDNAGWMPDPSQTQSLLSLGETNVPPRKRDVRKN